MRVSQQTWYLTHGTRSFTTSSITHVVADAGDAGSSAAAVPTHITNVARRFRNVSSFRPGACRAPTEEEFNPICSVSFGIRSSGVGKAAVAHPVG